MGEGEKEEKGGCTGRVVALLRGKRREKAIKKEKGDHYNTGWVGGGGER